MEWETATRRACFPFKTESEFDAILRSSVFFELRKMPAHITFSLTPLRREQAFFVAVGVLAAA